VPALRRSTGDCGPLARPRRGSEHPAVLTLLERLGSAAQLRQAGRRRLVTLLRPKAPRRPSGWSRDLRRVGRADRHRSGDRGGRADRPEPRRLAHSSPYQRKLPYAASKPRANEAPPGRHRAAARAPDRGPSGVQWAAGLTSIKIWKGPEAATANLRRSRGSLGRDNLPRAKLADQGHHPTDTQRAVGVMVFRSPLHVAAALPGENLGRIHAAGERVGRLGRIRRHARERC
jgi:hypothetical protein